MSLFVALEFTEFREYAGRAKPGNKGLSTIDVHRAMFAGVIYLEEYF